MDLFRAFRFEASGYISKSKLGSSFIEQNGFYVIARHPERVHGFELAADVYLHKAVMVGTSYSYVKGKRDGNGNDRYGDPEDTYLYFLYPHQQHGISEPTSWHPESKIYPGSFSSSC